MISKIEITGVKMDVDKKLHDYVTKKIGHLDRYMPPKARQSAHAEVFLKERKIKQKKECTAEVTIRLPKGNVTAKETTINIFAAVDIVEAKLKNQIKRYKGQHSILRGHTRRLIEKFRSQSTA